MTMREARDGLRTDGEEETRLWWKDSWIWCNFVWRHKTHYETEKRARYGCLVRRRPGTDDARKDVPEVGREDVPDAVRST